MNASALYVGHVMHQRLRPRRHKFRYGAFWLLFDLDEIDDLARRLALFSRNRFNLFSFHDKDFGDRSGDSPREHVTRELRRAGLSLDGGAIRLLTMPRVCGFVFNPLSIYFCHDREGGLRAIIWEVSNTFGVRHSYLIPTDDPHAATIRQSCAKAMHVSPFLDMDMTYRFRVAPPGETTVVSIVVDDAAGPMLVTAMAGERRALDDASLSRIFVSIPFATLKVVAAIHWEALRLWLKGVGFRASPPPPVQPVSFIGEHGAGE